MARPHRRRYRCGECGGNLAQHMRLVWERFNGADTIAQAIDLGLGSSRAKEVLKALEARLTKTSSD